MNLKRILATSLVGLSLLNTAGCYSVTVQGADLDKPVSVSHSTGRSGRVSRTFKYETITWYILGLAGVATFPGGPLPLGTNAANIANELAKAELAKGGNGIVDMSVSSQSDLMSFVGAIVVGIVPFVGWLIRPLSVTVEGKVVD